MHEGASGGKRDAAKYSQENNGQILIGENIVTGEKGSRTFRFLYLQSRNRRYGAMPSFDTRQNGKLTVLDAENSWFIRVDGVKGYGDDPLKANHQIERASYFQYPICT